jgi:hypothetical protein
LWPCHWFRQQARAALAPPACSCLSEGEILRRRSFGRRNPQTLARPGRYRRSARHWISASNLQSQLFRSRSRDSDAALPKRLASRRTSSRSSEEPAGVTARVASTRSLGPPAKTCIAMKSFRPIKPHRVPLECNRSGSREYLSLKTLEADQRSTLLPYRSITLSKAGMGTSKSPRTSSVWNPAVVSFRPVPSACGTPTDNSTSASILARTAP